jgi:hypothetical protein
MREKLVKDLVIFGLVWSDLRYAAHNIVGMEPAPCFDNDMLQSFFADAFLLSMGFRSS